MLCGGDVSLKLRCVINRCSAFVNRSNPIAETMFLLQWYLDSIHKCPVRCCWLLSFGSQIVKVCTLRLHLLMSDQATAESWYVRLLAKHMCVGSCAWYVNVNVDRTVTVDVVWLRSCVVALLWLFQSNIC